jgi:thiamine biosynthesis lipoprotein
VDDETAALIDHALAYYTASDGAFDITSGLLRTAWDFSGSQLPDQRTIDALLPRIGLDKVTLSRGHLAFTHPGMELDFGGLAKEYAADSAAEICSGLGIRHGFVNLAGDIRVIGPQPNGLPWRIGIRHPRDPHVLAAVVALHDGALATSGDYERFIEIGTNRYCHILDPRTGWPAQGLRSVTVLAPCCLSAGILSTAAMVKGADGADWLRSLGVRHIVIDDRGSYVGTEPSGLRP